MTCGKSQGASNRRFCPRPGCARRCARSGAARTIPVEMQVRVDGRLTEPVEVGAYYVVSEMLANAAEHARASVVEVDAEASGGTLRLRVRDDGIGSVDPGRASGLLGLKDRIEALGGTVVHAQPGGPRHHSVMRASGYVQRRILGNADLDE